MAQQFNGWVVLVWTTGFPLPRLAGSTKEQNVCGRAFFDTRQQARDFRKRFPNNATSVRRATVRLYVSTEE